MLVRPLAGKDRKANFSIPTDSQCKAFDPYIVCIDRISIMADQKVDSELQNKVAEMEEVTKRIFGDSQIEVKYTPSTNNMTIEFASNVI